MSIIDLESCFIPSATSPNYLQYSAQIDVGDPTKFSDIVSNMSNAEFIDYSTAEIGPGGYVQIKLSPWEGRNITATLETYTDVVLPLIGSKRITTGKYTLSAKEHMTWTKKNTESDKTLFIKLDYFTIDGQRIYPGEPAPEPDPEPDPTVPPPSPSPPPVVVPWVPIIAVGGAVAAVAVVGGVLMSKKKKED